MLNVMMKDNVIQINWYTETPETVNVLWGSSDEVIYNVSGKDLESTFQHSTKGTERSVKNISYNK